MSTLNDKKAELLAKIAKQKAKQKEKIFTIPIIKLTTKEKQQKEKKTSIPNTKILNIRGVNDDKMREFLSELDNLGDADVESTSGVYNNIIVFNGYKLFVDSYIKETVLSEDDPDIDREEIRKDAEKEWESLSLFSKKIWIIKGYGFVKDAEFGRKKFTEDVERNVNSEVSLTNFISSYLKGDIKYSEFITSWNTKLGVKEKKDDNDVSGGEDTENIRLPVTEEEEVLVVDLKERLAGYENALSELEDNIIKRTEILSELSHGELVNLVKNIIGKKTKEQLIDNILNIEYGIIERKGYNDREFRKIELDKMSYRDLVINVSANKTSEKLVELLVQDEFYRSRKKIVDKIFKTGIKIKNLSLGKYVPRQSNVKLLKNKERKYRDAIIVQIRRLELQTKSYDKLVVHASSIGAMKDFNKKERSSGELINNILNIEFPDYNILEKIPSVTGSEMKVVLMTLDEDQINILAFANGIKNPNKRGKYYNIDSIIKKEFPVKESKSTKQLVIGSVSYNWSYHKRRSELEGLSTNDLKNIGLTLGLDLTRGVKNEQLIKGILEYEEYVSKLIPKEEQDKKNLINKISAITGAPKSRYSLWSLEDLNQRLDVLKDESQEYWVEMEKERLYNKIAQIVDIKQSKYKNCKKWSINKLRRKLENIAGSNWEDYKPLIEDYSFVKCMENFNRYEWIEGKVSGVWLSGPNGEAPNNEYIFKDISIEEDGHIWYQANKKFFVLQCNMYKNNRIQNGDVLTSYTQTGDKVKFMVGYTISGYQYEKGKYKNRTHMVKTNDGRLVQRTFIIQDEIIFNKEKEYMNRSIQTQTLRIQDILNSIVSERTANNVMKSISLSLLEIAPMKSDYGIIKINKIKSDDYKTVDYNTPYMQILMKTLRNNPEQTNKELFTKAASLLVFLNIPESKTFRHNVYNEYYLPDIIATLSPAEKFPEAFEDPNASGKFLDELTANINNNIFKIVKDFANTEYQSQDTTRRKYTDPTPISFNRSIKTNKRLNACENKSRVEGSPEEEIVYYNDNGKIYCFTVNELYTQLIIEENINNPETGNPFDISFVKRFDELYNKKLAEDGILTGYFQKKYGFDMGELVKNKQKKDTKKSEQPIIGKNIWEIIGKDLSELEDQLSNEKPGDGDEIDEERDEERRDVEVRDGIRPNREINENDVCEYCKNHLSDDSIKSIILHGDESRIIKFCSFKCFEDKNDWNKFKIKKDKKKVKTTKKIKKQIEKSFVKSQKNKNLVLKEDKWVKKSPTPIKMSRDEIKQRKKLIKKQVKEGAAQFDKIAFPLMSKEELREIAKEKDIKIPGGLDKMGTASFLYKILHPKSTKGVLKENTAKKEILKIEKKKSKDKDKKSKSKDKDKKSKSKDKDKK